MRLGPSVLAALAALALEPRPALAAQRIAVLTPDAPWAAECQGTPPRPGAARERCDVLETLADEVRAGVLAGLEGAAIDVMTRENTAEILKEMGTAACTEGECEVETARLVGADYVVSGNVTLVEGTWFATMKLHAAASARLLRTSERVKARSQVELIEAMRPAAEALARAALGTRGPAARPPAAPPAPEAPRTAWLTVETAQPGVRVSIDGASAGRAPLRARETDEGTVEVAVADPCYLPTAERVRVRAGERRTVRLAAKPRLAALRVDAQDGEGNLLEAIVNVDGAPAGVTGRALEVPVCSRRASVQLGSERAEARLALVEGKTAVVVVRPDPGAAAGGMVRIPGGTYTPKEGQRPANVRPFLLDVVEVTAAEYGACVDEGACDPPGTGPVCTFGVESRRDHPVNCVSWHDAGDYCRFAGKRLPTDEEWEWAARGAGRASAYPWGDAPPAGRLCWSGEGDGGLGRRSGGTCPVGAHPSGDSPHGVKDLAGNVWEWTASELNGGRVFRGGGWPNDDAADVGALARKRLDPSFQLGFLGFRCASNI
jgi:formylglycine-generating enzyme required for sulfatase activity